MSAQDTTVVLEPTQTEPVTAPVVPETQETPPATPAPLELPAEAEQGLTELEQRAAAAEERAKAAEDRAQRAERKVARQRGVMGKQADRIRQSTPAEPAATAVQPEPESRQEPSAAQTDYLQGLPGSHRDAEGTLYLDGEPVDPTQQKVLNLALERALGPIAERLQGFETLQEVVETMNASAERAVQEQARQDAEQLHSDTLDYCGTQFEAIAPRAVPVPEPFAETLGPIFSTAFANDAMDWMQKSGKLPQPNQRIDRTAMKADLLAAAEATRVRWQPVIDAFGQLAQLADNSQYRQQHPTITTPRTGLSAAKPWGQMSHEEQNRFLEESSARHG